MKTCVRKGSEANFLAITVLSPKSSMIIAILGNRGEIFEEVSLSTRTPEGVADG